MSTPPSPTQLDFGFVNATSESTPSSTSIPSSTLPLVAGSPTSLKLILGASSSWGNEYEVHFQPPSLRPGFIFISLSNRVYYLPVDNITRVSLAFDGMFSLPQPDSDEMRNSPGMSFENPLILDGHAMSDEWNVFFTYVYGHHHSADPPVRNTLFWLRLLRFSKKFIAPHATSQAKEALDRTTGSEKLNAFQQFIYGHSFGFSDWVATAAPMIVATPFNRIPESEFLLLDNYAAYVLAQFHFRLAQHRQLLAVYLPQKFTPSMHSSTCINNADCYLAWRTSCDLFVGAILRASPPPMTELQVLRLMQTRKQEGAKLSDMSTKCYRQVLRAVENSLTGRDDQLTTDTVRQLISLRNGV